MGLRVEFEWDEEKAASNVVKHKLSFEDAIAVFDDRDALVARAKTVAGEQRSKRTGMVEGGVLLTIIYAWRDVAGLEIARIISARAASRKERRDYGNRSIPA